MTQDGTPKRIVKGRAWCFTLNNWTPEELNSMLMCLADGEYVIGEEVGENGTLHLQGVVRWKNPRHLESVKKILGDRCQVEKCKNWNSSKNYSSKDGKTHKKLKDTKKNSEKECEARMLRKFRDVTWKKWQKEIIDIIESEPDERTVHWYWEESGNVGKTFLTIFLYCKYDAIVTSGRQTEVFQQYRAFLKKGYYPKATIIDIPRSRKNYVCYSIMENIKDGIITSSKYKCGKIRLIPHHLIIFANFPPKEHKLSQDRWHIVKIEESNS